MQKIRLFRLLLTGCVITLVVGCADPNPKAAAPEEKKENIIGRKTDKVGEFDAENSKEADISIDSSRPLHAMTAGAYKNAAARIAQMGIAQAVNLFNAEHGRYPKDHDEFMEKIIKANSFQLPVLPGGLQYAYDVENHELKIVEAEKK